MLVKIQNSYRCIVAICDSELLGKSFEEDKFQLDVKKSFFEGDEKSEKETIEIIQKMKKEDATFNIIGKKSTNAAIKAGIISKDSVKTLQGIPFALVLM